MTKDGRAWSFLIYKYNDQEGRIEVCTIPQMVWKEKTEGYFPMSLIIPELEIIERTFLAVGLKQKEKERHRAHS